MTILVRLNDAKIARFFKIFLDEFMNEKKNLNWINVEKF